MVNPVIAKIAKILAKAKDQENTPEGELAAKLAAKMMREHAISMAEVGGVSLDSDPMVQDRISVGRAGWKSSLAFALALHCNCKAVRMRLTINAGGSQSAVMKVFGHKTDVEVCAYLYAICERQITSAVKQWRKSRSEELSYLGINRIPYREGQAYRLSMVNGLRHKLAEIRRAGEKEDAMGTAMVLSRLKTSEEFAMSKVKIVGTFNTSCSGKLNIEAFNKGKNMTLHQGIGGSTNKHPSKIQ